MKENRETPIARRTHCLLLFLASLLLLQGVASAQTITEFPLPTTGSPFRIAVGPNGNLWFTEFVEHGRIGRITIEGSVTEFALPTPFDSTPAGIAAGPDGNLWFTAADFELGIGASLIGRIAPDGAITEFTGAASPYDIAAGADGNLWFTEADSAVNSIGRITTMGVIREFPIPTPGYPSSITSGPDGNLWFTEVRSNKIGQITTSGVITEFSISTAASEPSDIAAGPDGNIWFTEQHGNKIGRITTAGVITEFVIPTAASLPSGITAGPEGNIWFTERFGNRIGRITTAGVVTEFPVPTASSEPVGITAGPDGTVWFTELSANKIGRIAVDRSPALETRILPVVGSTPGANGTFFRTSVQLHNSSSTPIAGRIVFHPSGIPGSKTDPAVFYSLAPSLTEFFPDLLPAMGRSGVGSADVEVTSGSAPVVMARVFNDAGASGTTGFTEEPMRSEDALGPERQGVLLIPSDLVAFRFNIGVRTLEAAASMTLTVRNAAGAIVATVPRSFPAIYHVQQGALEFLEGATLPAGGSVTVAVDSGNAILYGATVDNSTGDPSLQIARAAP